MNAMKIRFDGLTLGDWMNQQKEQIAHQTTLLREALEVVEWAALQAKADSITDDTNPLKAQALAPKIREALEEK